MKLNALIATTGLLYLLRFNAAVATLNSRRINPYEKVWKTLHKEPASRANTEEVGGSATKHDYSTAVQEKWLEQQVDHFAADTSNHTWMMRYYANSELYQPGGPIFIYVGGEWEISPDFLQTSHFYDMARQHGAMLFYTEHRYYGKSWTVRDVSVENLRYLNVLQSLEDLNYFIKYHKSTEIHLRDAKVVLAGGSYSGSMVTWFMKLYPYTANVAWASSAPLVAKMDFHEYMTLAMQSIKEKGGAKCARNLQKGFKGLQTLLNSDEANDLMQRLGSCSYFDATHEMDIAAFFSGLGNYFAQVVQGQGSQITQFCNSFLSMNVNPTESLVKYFRELYLPGSEEEDETTNDHNCLDLSYGGMKSIFSPTADTATRCWFYQTCHEFGWFTTTATATATATPQIVASHFSGNSPFAGQVSLGFFHRLCQDVFAAEEDDDDAVGGTSVGGGLSSFHDLHSKAEGINRIFGGLYNISQRVIFTHGLLDPWRAVGQQQGPNVLLIRDYSHVEDMGSIDLSDTVEMNVAKLKVAAFISKALRE